MPITRHINDLHTLFNELHNDYLKSKSSKTFIQYFNTQVRQGMCGKPVATENTILSFHNLPTAHFYHHGFDFLKDLNYEMCSRNYTASGKNMAANKLVAKAVRSSSVPKVQERTKQHCENCKKECAGYVYLVQHLNKPQFKNCWRFYRDKRLLEALESSKKNEQLINKKSRPKSETEKLKENMKFQFAAKMKLHLKICVNQAKSGGNSANIENFNTTREFLHPKNRAKVLSMYYCADDDEKKALQKLIMQMNVILIVSNSIGIIKVQKWADFLREAAVHWASYFNKYRKLKNSLHWNLAHNAQLVAENGGYSLAEVAETSIECTIKKYRDVSENLARQTNFSDHTYDCLKTLYILSSHTIRKFNNEKLKKEPENDEATFARSFFLEDKVKHNKPITYT